MASEGEKAHRRKQIRWGIVLGGIVFAAWVVSGSLGIAGYECAVCVEFRGNSSCRTVQGATREEAQRSAMNNACALIASGVTDSIACERSQPTKLECRPIN